MSKTSFIYILSQRYSGSTLLSFLLGTHPQIATIGERRKFFVHSMEKSTGKALNCSCGKPFPECEHWNTIKGQLQSRFGDVKKGTNPTEFKFSHNKYVQKLSAELFKTSFSNDMPILRAPLKSKLKDFERFNELLVEESLKLDEANVFLDSSKVIDHVLYLSMIESFDIKVVWLTRDPRAQVNSALKYNKWTIPEATNHWKREMEQNEYWLKKLNINYTSLNYEALCRNPQSEMVRLLDFLNLDTSLFSLDFREQTQHIMGNYSMRLGGDTKITERTEWMDQLKPEEIKTIEDMTDSYRQYYRQED